jgi:hypothetical protein
MADKQPKGIWLGKEILVYIWQSQSEINVNICNIVRERCNDIERQNLFSDINVEISLIFYCEIKYEWGKVGYIDKCTRKERMEIIWLREGIWKLRGIRRGFERGRSPLCLEEENAKHILLKCSETKQWREEYVNSNWLNINEDLAYRKIISCTNVNKIKSLGKCLSPPKSSWKPKQRLRNWTECRNSKGDVVVVVVLVALAIATHVM